jgi:hypothetical protein
MGLRDIVALPATLLFVVGGFYWIIVQRLRGIRARIKVEGPSRTSSRWQRLSPRDKMLRRIAGIVLGIVVAVVLQAIWREILDAASR